MLLRQTENLGFVAIYDMYNAMSPVYPALHTGKCPFRLGIQPTFHVYFSRAIPPQMRHDCVRVGLGSRSELFYSMPRMVSAQSDQEPMLTMVWPSELLGIQVDPRTPPGYTIRTYAPGDEQSFLALMQFGDFDPWDEKKLAYNISKILPEGWFFAVEMISGRLVGTAMCLHNYTGRRPFCGDVGWVVCHPEHRGHGLGFTLTACVTNRFQSAGYSRIYLGTEHYRLAAVRTYLKLGYVPIIDSPSVRSLWLKVCEKIAWPFIEEKWERMSGNGDAAA